jgi:serine O-acetyltransferase
MKGTEIKTVADKLSDLSTEHVFTGYDECGTTILSDDEIKATVKLCRSILLPGYFDNAKDLCPPEKADEFIASFNGNGPASKTESRDAENLQRQKTIMEKKIKRLDDILIRQIEASFIVGNKTDGMTPEQRHSMSEDKTSEFIKKLPGIRHTLATDIEATYNGDPAATSYDEVICCYPAIRAVCNYRIAHELLLLNIPLIPRMISEMAHRETGIDIHPRAVIGNSFTIDHGTGVVIGATSIIGSNVKIYQGVTLGAKSFPLDEDGKPIKGIQRHPIIEDDVIIYSNATILGRIIIGKKAVIGANIWITADVAPGQHIVKRQRNNKFPKTYTDHGKSSRPDFPGEIKGAKGQES